MEGPRMSTAYFWARKAVDLMGAVIIKFNRVDIKFPSGGIY